MGIFDKLSNQIENSKFCYAKDGGNGYVDKAECTCNRDCQACQDMNNFHRRFNEVGKEMGYKYPETFEECKQAIEMRAEIINIIKPEFKDSKWYKDNVIE